MTGRVEDRLLFAAKAMHGQISEAHVFTLNQVSTLRTEGLRKFLTSRNELRRVFPQQLFHFLLSEACVDAWDTCEGRGQTAMFHLGALSGLLTGIETPGWTSANDYRWQIIGLCQYGAEEGRVDEQPLIVRPEGVTLKHNTFSERSRVRSDILGRCPTAAFSEQSRSTEAGPSF